MRTATAALNAVQLPLRDPQGWSRWRVLVLDYFLDDAVRHARKLVHQALRVPMKRMGHHVVHLLTQGPSALL